MPSFDSINYSLRPSKSIQRHIVFEGARRLQAHIDWEKIVYIGLGSIWFTDFTMAHKVLGIDSMVSIEADDIGFHRAVFNAPYATVKVRKGYTSEILPELFVDPDISSRPWLVWLDYDGAFDETCADDIRSVIENAPANTTLLVTVNAHEMSYGRAPDRVERLRDIFGAIVPDVMPKRACRDERMQETLADFALGFMQSIASDIARPGGFIPAFRVIYQDSAPMVTVGGVLPSKGSAKIVRDVIANESWCGKPAKPILAPNLTLKEAATLQAKLPSPGKLSRAIIQELGFDLEEDQIEAFQTYYRQYPAFAQILP